MKIKSVFVALFALLISVSGVSAQDECVTAIQRYYPEATAVNHKVNLGMFIPGVYDIDQYLTVLSQYEGAMGLPHGSTDVLIFNAWGDGDRPFPAKVVAQAAAQGRQVIVTSEPWKRDFENLTAPQPEFSLESIVAGNHDEYLRNWAQEAANLGVPIIYRFAQEMSTVPGTIEWYPWQGDPEGYVAAYRHIHDVFQSVGALNIRYMWSAMKYNEPQVLQYYPGDEYVDLIGTTVLNHGTANKNYPIWLTVDDIYSRALDPIVNLWPGKPIYIAELGTAEDGGSKGDWLIEAFARIAYRYPVEGVTILHGSDFTHPEVNWSIDSSIEALGAMQLISRCYLNH